MILRPVLFSLKKCSLVLADRPYKTRSVGGQSSSADEVVPKTNVKNVVRPMGSVIASRGHGHIFCSGFMFYL